MVVDTFETAPALTGLAQGTVIAAPRKKWDKSPGGGELLQVLINSINAKNILELGTAKGYMTLWLAQAAAAVNGNIKTVEPSLYKYSIACENFFSARQLNRINSIHNEIPASLAGFFDNEFDFILFDFKRCNYSLIWQELKRLLRPGGMLVISNINESGKDKTQLLKTLGTETGLIHYFIPLGAGCLLVSKIGTEKNFMENAITENKQLPEPD